jgi:hypothetical protein
MAYTLEQFCDQSRSLLKSQPIDAALSQMGEQLSRLLSDPDFVAKTFSESTPPGRFEIHKEAGLCIVGEVKAPNSVNNPHDHGSSWVIYGNAKNVAQITEWRRTNSTSQDHAELMVTGKHTLGAGATCLSQPYAIHSTANVEKTWLVRVSAVDVETLQRYKWGKNDRIVEREKVIEPA